MGSHSALSTLCLYRDERWSLGVFVLRFIRLTQWTINSDSCHPPRGRGLFERYPFGTDYGAWTGYTPVYRVLLTCVDYVVRETSSAMNRVAQHLCERKQSVQSYVCVIRFGADKSSRYRCLSLFLLFRLHRCRVVLHFRVPSLTVALQWHLA